MDEKRNSVISIAPLTDFVKSGKGRRIIIAVGIIGILLIWLSSFLPEKKDKDRAGTGSITADRFVAETEQKLKSIIDGIEGAGPCRVMVTLENGVEYVYAVEQDINTDRKEDSDSISQRDDTKESIIVVDTGDGRQGLLVTEIQPTVKGVVVVCRGGDQPLVQQRITDAVTTALNISSKRVCVIKLSE